MGHDVFISHSSSEKHMALAVCEALEAKGVQCWLAPRDVAHGADYRDAIIEGIEGCKCLVLILSRRSNESDHVQREVRQAVKRGFPVLPVRIEECELSRKLEYEIGTLHWFDATHPPIEQHLGGVVREVFGLLGRDPTALAWNVDAADGWGNEAKLDATAEKSASGWGEASGAVDERKVAVEPSGSTEALPERLRDILRELGSRHRKLPFTYAAFAVVPAIALLADQSGISYASSLPVSGPAVLGVFLFQWAFDARWIHEAVAYFDSVFPAGSGMRAEALQRLHHMTATSLEETKCSGAAHRKLCRVLKNADFLDAEGSNREFARGASAFQPRITSDSKSKLRAILNGVDKANGIARPAYGAVAALGLAVFFVVWLWLQYRWEAAAGIALASMAFGWSAVHARTRESMDKALADFASTFPWDGNEREEACAALKANQLKWKATRRLLGCLPLSPVSKPEATRVPPAPDHGGPIGIPAVSQLEEELGRILRDVERHHTLRTSLTVLNFALLSPACFILLWNEAGSHWLAALLVAATLCILTCGAVMFMERRHLHEVMASFDRAFPYPSSERLEAIALLPEFGSSASARDKLLELIPETMPLKPSGPEFFAGTYKGTASRRIRPDQPLVEVRVGGILRILDRELRRLRSFRALAVLLAAGCILPALAFVIGYPWWVVLFAAVALGMSLVQLHEWLKETAVRSALTDFERHFPTTSKERREATNLLLRYSCGEAANGLLHARVTGSSTNDPASSDS